VRLPKRDATLLLKASTIASMRYALDRHRSRAAWFLKAGKPAFDIAKQAGGRPQRFADGSCPIHRESLPIHPFGRRSFNSI
jgi:hypothetical protein